MQQPHQSPVYRLAAGVLRPVLMGVTRRDWDGVEHLQRIPQGSGLVVCANHLSHVDPLTLAHFLLDAGRPPYFLAKEELFRAPVVGAVLRGAEQIPVRRGSGDARLALTAAEEAVARGRCVVVYPEATLTRDRDLWPMPGRPGAARIALTTGSPVVPVAQWGPQDILFPYSKRPHLLPPRTVHVLAGPPVALDDLRSRPLETRVLAEATRRIMADVTGLLERLRGETAPVPSADERGTTDVTTTGNGWPHASDSGIGAEDDGAHGGTGREPGRPT